MTTASERFHEPLLALTQVTPPTNNSPWWCQRWSQPHSTAGRFLGNRRQWWDSSFDQSGLIVTLIILIFEVFYFSKSTNTMSQQDFPVAGRAWAHFKILWIKLKWKILLSIDSLIDLSKLWKQWGIPKFTMFVCPKLHMITNTFTSFGGKTCTTETLQQEMKNTYVCVFVCVCVCIQFQEETEIDFEYRNSKTIFKLVDYYLSVD